MQDKKALRGSSFPAVHLQKYLYTAHLGSGWQRTAAGHFRHGSGTLAWAIRCNSHGRRKARRLQ